MIVNLQGDEPFIDPKTIERTAAPFLTKDETVMSTAMYPIYETEVLENRSVVKVVTDRRGGALYFSRQAIPFHRDGFPRGKSPLGFKHIGLYAYTRDFLLRFARMAPTPLEKAEGLEQLRALESGFRIRVVPAVSDSLSVDTAHDLEIARRHL